MNNFLEFFNKYFFYIATSLLVLDIVLAFWIFALRQRIKKIFKGEGGDLEKVLLELREKQDGYEKLGADFQERIKKLEEALPKDIKKIGLVRYNPFSDAGGDQSFALALLNEQNDGIILSSLYGREMNRVYAKPITKGGSQYQLTDEEKTAIQNAK